MGVAPPPRRRAASPSCGEPARLRARRLSRRWLPAALPRVLLGVVGLSLLSALGGRRLLAGDRPPRPFSGPRIRVGALPADGQVAPMPQPPITPEIDETLDVGRDVAGGGASNFL